MSDRFDTLFKDGQLTTRFRLSLAWRVVKVELQWRLIRLRQWWHENMPSWLMGRDKKWDDIAEQVLDMEVDPSEALEMELDSSDDSRLEITFGQHLSLEEVEHLCQMPPRGSE